MELLYSFVLSSPICGRLFFPLSEVFVDFFVALFALFCSPVQAGANFLSSWELVFVLFSMFFRVCVSLLFWFVYLCLWLIKVESSAYSKGYVPVHKVVTSRCSSEMKAHTSWAHPSAGLHTS